MADIRYNTLEKYVWKTLGDIYGYKSKRDDLMVSYALY